MIRSQLDYVALNEKAKRLNWVGSTFPEMVFTKNYQKHWFCDDFAAFGLELLKSLSAPFDDTSIYFFCLEPSGEFWKEKVGHFGCFEFSLNSHADAWAKLLDDHPPSFPLSLRICSEQAVIWGSSGNWCLFIDTYWQMAVIGTQNNAPVRQNSWSGHLYSLDEALVEWKKKGFKLTENETTTLKQNYGI
jgi:hypothetical protein